MHGRCRLVSYPRHQKGPSRAFYPVVRIGYAYGQLIGALKSLSCDSAARRQNIRAEWNGSLDQEGDSRVRQFDGRPLCHYLFKF